MGNLSGIGLYHPWVFMLIPAPWLVYYLLPPVQPVIRCAMHAPSLFLLSKHISSDTTPKRKKCALNTPFFLVPWLASLLAFAHPFHDRSANHTLSPPATLLIALDISKSMTVTDSQSIGHSYHKKSVSRLESAKEFLEKLVRYYSEYPIGLMLFGEFSLIAVPCTHDHATLLSVLHNSEAGMAGERTSLGDVIADGISRLKSLKASSEKYTHTLILLTDGENTSGAISPLQAAREAVEHHIPVHTLMTGKENTQQDQYHHGVLQPLSHMTGGKKIHIEHPEAFHQLTMAINSKIPKKMSHDSAHEESTFRYSLIIWPLLLVLVSGFFWLYRLAGNGRLPC